MTAISYLLTVRQLSGPRGEHEAPADRTFLAAEIAVYEREYSDPLPEFIGPVIPWGEFPMSPQMIREWWLAWWELERVSRERKFGSR